MMNSWRQRFRGRGKTVVLGCNNMLVKFINFSALFAYEKPGKILY